MKHLIIALMLLVATPTLASPQYPTEEERKDAKRFTRAFFSCHEYDPSYVPSGIPYDDENLMYKKACDLHDKLSDKFEKQGFCFYGRYYVGRPDGENCIALPSRGH